MSLTLSTPFVVAIAVLFTLLLVNSGIQKNKKVLVLLGTVPLMVGSFYINNQKQVEVEKEQTLYAQQAFESLYRPDYLNVQKAEKTKEHTIYQLETPSGMYTISFGNQVTDAFEVTEEEGEPLRGRKNVFDTLEMIQVDLDTSSVWYENPNTYIAETLEKEYRIELKNDAVITIVDEQQNIVFQREEDGIAQIKNQPTKKEEVK